MGRKIYFLIIFLLSIISFYLGFNSTIIPNIILYFAIIFYVINLLIIYILLMRKKKILRILGIFLSLILLIGDIALTFVYIRANKFFNKITNIEYETSSYSVIVLKDSKFEKLDDIISIGIYNTEIDTNYKDARNILNEKKELNNKEYDNIVYLIADLYEKKIDSIFINENFIDIIDENDTSFKEKTKVIETIDIKKEKEKKEEEANIKKLGNFNIYISGIDTYGAISKVSRSDVNMIATINMKENKILLTNTPRDYYVQLHGTTGNKDKLTHAGVYGINMSISTLEDLYDTKINYYIRVNFNTLISLVDQIGGIDIYSDMSFNAGGVHFNYGWNHLNGNQALTYARERKVYYDGDRHRGKNQQQIIEAIIKKVTESNDVNTYVKLLTVLEKSINTNFDKKLINGFINLQVKNKYNWSVESQSVTGYDDGGYTYSYPGQYLYVMQPDYESLNNAKNKIQSVLKSE